MAEITGRDGWAEGKSALGPLAILLSCCKEQWPLKKR